MKVALITGGARGIGRATAERLSADGYKIALCDIDGSSLAVSASALGATFEFDVADRDAFADAVKAVESELGPIDVLVNNAGVMALGPLLASEPTANERIIQTNLTGLVNGLQLVVPRMRERNRGHVVNVASYAARYGVPGEGVYAATKHAMWALSEILRRELRSTQIMVTIALMGPVARTGLAAGMKPQRGVPMVSPREVANAISGALRQPRFELWIPRRQGWLHALAHLLPRPVRELAENAAGMGRVATDIDWSVRRGYEAMAFGDNAAEHATD